MPSPGAVVSSTITYFQGGSPVTNIPATTITVDWLNSVNTELINLVTSVGLTPSKTNFTQLAQAVGQVGKATPGLEYLYFSTQTSVVGGSTTFIGPCGIGTVDAGARWMFPVNGTITGVYLSTSAAPAGIQTATGTVFINGSSSAAACTLTGSATSNTATTSVAVTANQALSLHLVLSATAATAYVSGYVVVQPT